MKSPVYPELEMEKVEKYGITYDFCPKSKGIWFDEGELEKVVKYIEEKVKNRVGNSNGENQQNENPLADLLDFLPF